MIAPPRPKLPPLNALRAFEAAARLGGFSAAADELCVTPGAVSQHIKTLEDWVGASLFTRRSQGVRLTEAGLAATDELAGAFDALGQAARKMRAAAGPETVEIAALPSVAQLWLLPRMAALRAAFAPLAFSVSAMEAPPNLAREMFEFSVFFRAPPFGPSQFVLARDRIFPVCHPDLAGSIRSPEDLRDATLLTDASWAGDWDIWARACDPPLGLPVSGPSYSLFSMALEDARTGAGVLIAHEALVSRDLARGDLVAPLPQRAETGLSLVLECPDIEAQRLRAERLVDVLTQPVP